MIFKKLLKVAITYIKNVFQCPQNIRNITFNNNEKNTCILFHL